MTRVKICGIRSLDEAQAAKSAGAWAIGEVFAASPRRIEIDRAAAINRELGRDILKVGVFVNEPLENLKHIAQACVLDMVQLHGEESPEYLEELPFPAIKSFRVRGPVDPEEFKRWRPWAYLFDTYSSSMQGGTGKAFQWEWLNAVIGRNKIILAGGLNENNVDMAIRKVRPLAIDISSGVEYPKGGKNPVLIERLITKVKEVDLDVSRS